MILSNGKYNFMVNINSLENKKIKDIIKLKKASERKEKNCFLIDGYREIQIAINAGVEIDELLYCPNLSPEQLRLLNINNAKVIQVSEPIFKKISYKEKPDGFLAIAQMKTKCLDDVKLSANPLIIVLENIEKPGNLGAIMRTAFAADVDAIIINDNQTDIFNPNVIRASEGHVFTSQIIIADLSETEVWLKKNGVRIVATSIEKSKSYLDVDYKEGVALVFGSEADGLSKKWLKLANEVVKIPMKADIDSLNVSVSMAIITFECKRQRNIV